MVKSLKGAVICIFKIMVSKEKWQTMWNSILERKYPHFVRNLFLLIVLSGKFEGEFCHPYLGRDSLRIVLVLHFRFIMKLVAVGHKAGLPD